MAAGFPSMRSSMAPQKQPPTYARSLIASSPPLATRDAACFARCTLYSTEAAQLCRSASLCGRGDRSGGWRARIGNPVLHRRNRAEVGEDRLEVVVRRLAVVEPGHRRKQRPAAAEVPPVPDG